SEERSERYATGKHEDVSKLSPKGRCCGNVPQDRSTRGRVFQRTTTHSQLGVGEQRDERNGSGGQPQNPLSGEFREEHPLETQLDVAHGVGRIKLARYAYLADCEAFCYLGLAISNFRYRFDKHGPFDPTFFDAKDELVRGGYASETTTKIGPYDGYDYRPTDQTVQYGFSQAEAEILRYVA